MSLLEKPFTRTAFKNHIKSILTEAALVFCQYLYAAANSKRADAARYRDQVQGMVEYELPMGLLHPTRNLAKRSTREKAVKEVMSIIEAEMAHNKRVVERMYTKWGRKASEKNSCEWKAFRLKKPLVRPAASCFEEFFQWTADVVTQTFDAAETMRATFIQKKP
jgi:hypothetical protein